MSLRLTKVKKEKLKDIQKRIAKKVVLEDRFPKTIKNIAGFDLAFSDDEAFVAGVVIDYKTSDILEIKVIETNLSFPYIPTFLTFREGPPIIKVYNRLNRKPDVILINGQGIIHPIHCGIASHIGVSLDVPSIGVAQSKLCGEYKEPKKVGHYNPITYNGKKVGYVYKSKKNCKPIFISPGHRVSLSTSLKIVVSCMGKYKLPLPLRMAHVYANQMKKNYSRE